MAKEILMTMSSKGQVTIPAEVRRFLGLTKNQKVALVLEPETHSVRLKLPHYPSVASLEGAAGSLPVEMSWHHLRDIAREDHIERKFCNRR
jgi:AbrB family looped-hinge helix DNA binding protein